MVLEPYAEYGRPSGGRVYDPTPFEAQKLMEQARRRRMRFDDLTYSLSQETGERPSAVSAALRNWRAADLVPPPFMVKALGKQGRGTRGEWGDIHRLAYLVIRALRPKNKPLTIARRPTDVPLQDPKSQAVYTQLSRLFSSIERYRGLTPDQPEVLPFLAEAEKLLGPDGEWVVSFAAQPSRLTLNTSTLKRLFPVSHGESPERLKELADVAPGNVGDVLEREALLMIWATVARIETENPIHPEDLRWQAHDVIAIRNEETLWRLDNSIWKIAHH